MAWSTLTTPIKAKQKGDSSLHSLTCTRHGELLSSGKRPFHISSASVLLTVPALFFLSSQDALADQTAHMNMQPEASVSELISV